MRPTAATASAALHGAAVVALFALFQSEWISPPPPKPERPLRFVRLEPYRPFPREAGGGQRDILPASKGRLPPPPKHRVFVPPTAVVLNDRPKLAVEQAVLVAPDIDLPPVTIERIGSPFGVDGPLSGGRGGPLGIGDGGCCGVGDGKGPGVGGSKPPSMRVVQPRRFSLPVLIYKVEPEYSEPARKARVQGIVLLQAEIDTDGHCRNLRVARPLGLGLDEQAIEAAGKWRFRPAMADGKPVDYAVTIEVNFRLL